jgi:carbon storage regulator
VLVLSRRTGESIVIGNDVTITVLEVRGDVIRLGIDAPRNVVVHRQEVYEQIADANRAATVSAEEASTFAASLRKKTD